MNQVLILLIVTTLGILVSLNIIILKKEGGFQEPILVSKNVVADKKEEVEPKLEDFFDKQNPQNDGSIITLLATGDVIPARSVNFQVNLRKDFTWPYLKTYQVTKDADITLINLETPLIKDCPLTNEGMIFCGDYRNIEGLTFAGVDIASLGNNHAANHGKKGVVETIENLQKANIKVTGVAGPEYIKIKNTTFAFLGYTDIEKNPFISSVQEEIIKSEITQARENADVVIVEYHWGAEYRSQPDNRQVELGRMTIDAGADLVIGNHPHWIQPVEVYNGKLITYAHGNFVFDQEWSQKTKEGVLGKYFFKDKQLIDVEFFPIEIKDYGQPYFLEGGKKQKILDEMYNQSLILKRTEISQ